MAGDWENVGTVSLASTGVTYVLNINGAVFYANVAKVDMVKSKKKKHAEIFKLTAKGRKRFLSCEAHRS